MYLLNKRSLQNLQGVHPSHSYHLKGKAVDIAIIVENHITWSYSFYEKVAKHILKIADRKHLKITWGGTWNTLVDACHFQLEE